MFKKRKKFIIFMIVFVICYSIFLGILINKGIFTDRSQEEHIIYYDGNLYEVITYWTPTGKASKNDKAWVGYSKNFPKPDKIKGNKKILLYDNDLNNIFFTNKLSWLDDFSETVIYHKKDDILPKPYDDNAKIILEIDSKKEVIVSEELLSELKTFIKQCLIEPDKILKKERMNRGLATIKIIYEGYPAWQYFAWFGTYDGKVIMLPMTSSDKYVYFVLPDNLSKQIKQLIKD